MNFTILKSLHSSKKWKGVFFFLAYLLFKDKSVSSAFGELDKCFFVSLIYEWNN